MKQKVRGDRVGEHESRSQHATAAEGASRLPRFDSASPDPAYVPTILIVDDIDLNRRLLRGILKATPYRILEAKRPSVAFSVLDMEKVDLIVVDLVLPEMSGMEFCQMVKSDRRTQLIPILMLTSIQGIENEVAGLESGADDFLLKPLRPALVRSRVSTMLRHKALVDSLEEAESILFALAQSVEHRDRYTGMHCERLASYSIAAGECPGTAQAGATGAISRRLSARHREDQHSRCDFVQARIAHRRRMGDDAAAYHPRRTNLPPDENAGAGVADYSQPSRALGRKRISGRSGGRRYSAARADPASRRHL